MNYGKKLFVHIPRTAGLSVLEALPGVVHAEGILSLHNLTVEDYWSFTITRHPLDRLVSLCGYIYRPHHLTPETFRRWVKDGFKKDGQVYVVGRLKPTAFDLCTPQVECLGDFRLNKTFRFENLGELGLDLPHLNNSARSSWEDYYTDEILDLAMRRYARDFTLGYELP